MADHITDEAVTELRVGDRVQIADLGREDDYGTVIKGPHQMFTNDPTTRVSIEVPLVGTATVHVPVSDVRRIPSDEEQEIGLRSWIVTGESICDDPDEYNHPHMLFVHEGSLPEIIRTYLAANGLTPPGTAAALPVLNTTKDAEIASLRAALDKVADEHKHVYLDAYYYECSEDKALYARCGTCGNLPNGTLHCPTLAAASLRGEQ